MSSSKLCGRTLILVTMAVLFGMCSAHATEFVQGRKAFLSTYSGYRETVEQAVIASAKSWCGSTAPDCTGVPGPETWVDNNRWNWTGTMSYTSPSTGQKISQWTSGEIGFGCPTGYSAYHIYTHHDALCYRDDKPIPPCDECDRRKAAKVGNPVLANGGVKVQTDVDYTNASGSLQLVRTYRSDEGIWRHNYQIFGIDYNNADSTKTPPFACIQGIDPIFQKPWCFAYMGKGTANAFGVRRGAGRLIDFGTATDFSPPKYVSDRVSPVLDAGGAKVAWSVTNAAAQTTELFDLSGHLLSITARNGQVTTFFYSDGATPLEIAPTVGLLLKVQDAFGNALQFTYDSQSRMATMLDPAGNSTAYTYDTQGNLTKVTYPDGKSKAYVYNELAKTSNVAQTKLLTGIIDENNDRYATFSYFSDRRAKSTEHAGGAGLYSLSYPSTYQASVVSPLGATYVYSYSPTLGVLFLNNTTRPSAIGPGTVMSSTSLDANGNVSSYTDFDGTVTSYTYDLSRNLETKRVEASGTAAARTISTEWHSTYRIPTRVAEPLRRITFTHDVAGNVLTKTVQATSDANGSLGFNATLIGTARNWTYTYSSLGQCWPFTEPCHRQRVRDDIGGHARLE